MNESHNPSLQADNPYMAYCSIGGYTENNGVLTQVLIRRLLICKVCQKKDYTSLIANGYHVFNFSFMLILISFVISSIRAIDVNF